MREIDINSMLKVLKKYFIVLIVIILLISCISGMYYVSKFKPFYSSSVTFYLDKQPVIVVKDDQQEITYPMTQNELIDTSIGLIKTNKISAQIIINARYVNEISISDLHSMMTIEQITDTALFKLTITNEDKDVAFNLATEAYKIIPDELMNTLQTKAIVTAVDEPVRDMAKKLSIPYTNILMLDILSAVTTYALLLILELLGSTIYTADELKNNFSIPVIGQIAHWKLLRKKNKIDNKIPALITNETPFIITEGFNNIRTNLLQNQSGEKTPVYAVTSEHTDAGKSVIISNLAYSFTNIGKKVLLIDADMRYPMQNEIFSIENDKGLSELLSSNADVDIPFNNYITKTGIANLDILPSGKIPQNPSDLLSSKATEKLIDYATNEYDVVFID